MMPYARHKKIWFIEPPLGFLQFDWVHTLLKLHLKHKTFLVQEPCCGYSKVENQEGSRQEARRCLWKGDTFKIKIEYLNRSWERWTTTYHTIGISNDKDIKKSNIYISIFFKIHNNPFMHPNTHVQPTICV